jgi:ABC-2 type transport system ATP-binding protein
MTSTHADAETPARDAALLVRGLRKRYGAVTAVDGLDLRVDAGECFGLLGPNGAGKTTTIEICEGLFEPDDGEVVVLGMRWRADKRALRPRLGIALQETQLSDKLTVRETVRLFRSFYGPRGRNTAEVVGLVELREKLDARVVTLSGGQRQRLALACALVGDPELLFLDEPTTGLDPQSRRQVWGVVEELRRGGRTVVLTTHYMDEAERLCDRVAVVDHGRVIALGTPRALIASLGAEHVVEFAVADGVPVDRTVLAALPGVEQIREERGRWHVQVRAPHTVIPGVLAEVARSGATLTELRTHSATLEDVFVALTGRHLRDG